MRALYSHLPSPVALRPIRIRRGSLQCYSKGSYIKSPLAVFFRAFFLIYIYTFALVFNLQAVLWTLWSRLVRLQAYLRQLLADTPSQALRLSTAARRGEWGVLVANMDAEVYFSGRT